MIDVGKNIIELRKEKGMSQNEFAEKIGISRSYLGDLENNRKNPSVKTMYELSKKMEVDINRLLKK